MIWLIAIFIIVVYIGINISVDFGNNKDYNIAFDNACNISAKANKDYLDRKKTILNKVEKFYGKEVVSKLDKGTIYVGMNKALVKFAYGKPEEIREELKYNTRIERWYYNGYTNRLGNRKYRLELFIENNLLEGWKDL